MSQGIVELDAVATEKQLRALESAHKASKGALDTELTDLRNDQET